MCVCDEQEDDGGAESEANVLRHDTLKRNSDCGLKLIYSEHIFIVLACINCP